MLPLGGAVVLFAMLRDDPRFTHKAAAWMFTTMLAVAGVWWSATAQLDVVDRDVYVKWLDVLTWADSPFAASTVDTDPVFGAFLWGIGQLGAHTPEALFGAVAATMSVLMLVGYSRFLTPWSTVMAWVTTLCLGLFLAYSTVAVRQGLAVASLVLAVGLYVASGRAHWRWMLLLGLLAGSTHWSAVAFTAVLLSIAFAKVNLRLVALGWLAAAGLFLTGLQSTLLSGLTAMIPRFGEYTGSSAYSSYGSGGNRLVFLLFSLALGVLCWVGLRIRPDEQQRRLVTAYLAFNTLFLLLGFVAFSDRLAAYSWFLLPALVWHPLERVRGSLSGYAASWVVIVLLVIGWFGGIF